MLWILRGINPTVPKIEDDLLIKLEDNQIG